MEKIIKWIIVALFVEIFVFNFNSFILLFGDYPEVSMKSLDYEISGFTEQEDGSLELYNISNADESESDKSVSSNGFIEFSDIGLPIGTINIDIQSSQFDETTIKIDVSDATSKDYRTSVATMTVLNGYERTYTIPVQFSGDVSNLRLKFSLEDNQTITVRYVTFNKPISIKFSFLRFFLMLATVGAVYALNYTRSLQKTHAENPLKTRLAVTAITIVFCLITVLLACAYRTDSDGTFVDDFTLTTGNQITKELVDAFKSGQLELLQEPEQTLLELENPYDISQRKEAERESQLKYLWDHCLYDGHYYSYYGIGPVILLFLPYNLITGYYFSTTWAVMLFAIIGMVFLGLLYYTVIDKWFRNLQLNYIIIGQIILMVSCGIWFSVSRAAFYEIAISSGFAFALAGSYVILKSNIIGGGKISNGRVALGTALLAYAVLCRATLAVYCVAVLIPLFLGLKKVLAEKSRKKSRIAGYLTSAIVPFAVFGGVQMAYNWLRFDSPLSFGIEYSLTINDFTNSQFHFHFVFILLYAFLFAAPYIQPVFPFVYSSFHAFNLNGYMFVDDRWVSSISIGLFYRVLPMVAYFFAAKAYRQLDKKYRKKALAVILPFCVIAPLVIIFSSWESGYAIRYNADISWPLIIGAYSILFFFLQKSKNNGIHKLAAGGLTFAMFVSILLNLGQLYNFAVPRYVSEELTLALKNVARLFEFWR